MSCVEVIIPCYKYGHFLRECVESVLAQPGVEVRVLILDDASPDCTPEVAAELAARDRRIEYRRHMTNRGNIVTYNEGLDWAEGDYLLLLSADDLLVPGALRRAADLLDRHPEVGMAYGRAIHFQQGQPLPPPAVPTAASPWEVCPGYAWIDRYARNNCTGVSSPGVVVRTSMQHRIGYYLEELPTNADIELWMRFALHGAIGILHADQAYYRVHATNMHHRRDHNLLWLLQDRAASLEAALTRAGDWDPEICRLERRGRQTLAETAFWEASRAFDRGELDQCREFLDFALETYPDLRASQMWSRFCWKRRMGTRLWRFLRPLTDTLRAITTTGPEARP